MKITVDYEIEYLCTFHSLGIGAITFPEGTKIQQFKGVHDCDYPEGLQNKSERCHLTANKRIFIE